jgi:hypothetical protein
MIPTIKGMTATARRTWLTLGVGLVLLAPAGCGDENVELDDFGSGGRDGGVDGGNGGPCTAGSAQCNDCRDNDNDGEIDGRDIECTGATDDDEGSFATGIPGDNTDQVKQDCFFDGDSGSGNDMCELHICCLLDLMGGACPEELMPNQFDPDECVVQAECTEFCSPLTPPGCDCFGCCTLCDETGCFDVFTNPSVAPDCDETRLADSSACPACIKHGDCDVSCEPDDCILCPGQTEGDLPPSCGGQVCPGGLTACPSGNECDNRSFCSNGCCISVVQ